MTPIGVHRRKRGRASLVAVVVAAVLTTGAGVVAASGANASVKAAPAHVVAVAKVAAATAVKASADGVQTVAPGQRLAAGGDTLWLTPQGLNVVAPKSSGTDKPELIKVTDALPGKWTGVARGDASGTLWAGIYRGPVSSSMKITIKLGARTLEARVVTLAGKPGWGAFYLFDAGHQAGADKPVITVQG